MYHYHHTCRSDGSDSLSMPCSNYIELVASEASSRWIYSISHCNPQALLQNCLLQLAQTSSQTASCLPRLTSGTTSCSPDLPSSELSPAVSKLPNVSSTPEKGNPMCLAELSLYQYDKKILCSTAWLNDAIIFLALTLLATQMNEKICGFQWNQLSKNEKMFRELPPGHSLKVYMFAGIIPLWHPTLVFSLLVLCIVMVLKSTIVPNLCNSSYT